MKNLLTFAVASAVFALAACGSRGSPGGKDASGQIQKATSQGGLPTSVTYAQIYATADGETHLRDVTLPLTATVTSPPAQAVGVSEEQLATTTRFAAFQPHWGDYDRDNNILHTPIAVSNRPLRRSVPPRHRISETVRGSGECVRDTVPTSSLARSARE